MAPRAPQVRGGGRPGAHSHVLALEWQKMAVWYALSSSFARKLLQNPRSAKLFGEACGENGVLLIEKAPASVPNCHFLPLWGEKVAVSERSGSCVRRKSR